MQGIHVFVFAGFAVAAIGVAAPSLRAAFYWDDYHLIRRYEPRELAAVWRGTWDPDGVETRGLRPLTTLFNHSRATLFGEDVQGHRCFLALLFSVYLSLIWWVAVRLGAGGWEAAAACGLVITARNSVYHYVWISDGIHLAQGVIAGMAAVCLLAALEQHRGWLIAPGLLCCGAMLVTREEGVELTLTLMALIGYVAREWWAARRKAIWAVGGLIGLDAIYLVWRTIVITSASPPNPIGIAKQIWRTTQLAGPSPLGYAVMAVGIALLTGAVSLGLVRRGTLPENERAQWRLTVFWTILTGVCCLHGVFVERENLTLFSTSFYALALCCGTTFLVASIGRKQQWLARAAFLIAAGAGLWGGIAVRSAMDFAALPAIEANAEVLTRARRGKATVPADRLQRASHALAVLGYDDRNVEESLRAIACRATPGKIEDTKPFLPAQVTAGFHAVNYACGSEQR